MDNKIIRLELPAEYRYLSIIRACLAAILQPEEQLSIPERVTSGVELAVHETCVNIIEHAYSGTLGRINIAMKVLTNPRRLKVRISDNGTSFVLGKISQPNITNEVQIRGYGLYLVHQLMDEVTYKPQQGYNTWELVKNL